MSRNNKYTSSNRKGDMNSVIVTKKSLKEGIVLTYEDVTAESNTSSFRSKKVLRGCQTACLKASNLRQAAEIFPSESLTRRILEELRLSLLENDVLAAAKLMEHITCTSSKLLLPVIWKYAVVLFINQQSMAQGVMEEFLGMCIEQRLPEDQSRLIELLMSLPNKLRSFSKNEIKCNTKEEECINDSELSESDSD